MTSTFLKNTTDDSSDTWQYKEKRRLQEIDEYDLEVYDINDKKLQAITDLAAMMTDMPLAFVTLVGDKYVNFLSRSGCDLTGTGRENSFCNIAIEQTEFFEVCDSTIDPRFSENVFVKGQSNPLTYYGGFPMKSPNGLHLGSLCVCDFKTRQLSDNQKQSIQTLADQVVIHLELRKKNKKLEKALAKAEKLSKAKDDFVSNMSHELRTPLNAINGFAEILSKSNLDYEQREAIGIIKSSCEILITLINDILDFSKIESGKLQIEKIPFNLHKALKNIRDLLGKKAEEKNNKLVLNIDDRIPINLLGDKVRINQIIVNLLGNALKFTENGTVTVSANIHNETDNDITIDFSVKDTGIGIPQEKLESIFERFEQVGKETTRKYGGTGLGLNISKNLVELHNGNLKVRSKIGEGSEFYFTIKYDKVYEQDILKIESNNKNNILSEIDKINDIRILICEDNLVNIKLIKNLFKNRLSYIEIAENGKLALEILRKNKNFNVILMDIHMPEMDGIETTKYIRRIMKINIPIIGFTANSSKSERKICLEAGMNDYITKTFVPEEFYEKLLNSFTSKIFDEDKYENYTSRIQKSLSSKNVKFRFLENNINSLNITPSSSKKNSTKHVNRNQSDKYFKSKDKMREKLDSTDCYTTCNDNIKRGSGDLLKLSIYESANKFEISDTKKIIFIDNSNSEDSSESGDIIKDFNPNILKEISGDDKEFEIELIELFLTDFPNHLVKLEESIKNMDEKALYFIVHKMKSPLMMLGYYEIIEKLEIIKSLYHKETSVYLIKEYHKFVYDLKIVFKQLRNYIKVTKQL